jgi:uridine kinase
VEGLFVLAEPVVSELDLTFFLDVAADQRLLGRILRDIQERSADTESIISRYQRFVRPSYHVFIEPTKQTADVVVDFTYRRAAFTHMLIRSLRDYILARSEPSVFVDEFRRETYRVGLRPDEGAMPAAVNILELGKSFPDEICPPVATDFEQAGTRLVTEQSLPSKE